MEDKEKFIAEFNKILQEVAIDHKPTNEALEETRSILLDFLPEIEDDFKVVGKRSPDSFIAMYRKGANDATDSYMNTHLPGDHSPLQRKEDIRFLAACLISTYHYLIDYLEGLKTPAPPAVKRGRPQKPPADISKPFADYFETRKLYEAAIEGLVKGRLIDPKTKIRSEGFTGNKFAHIIKDLMKKRYFIDGKISAIEQVAIAKAEFGISITVSVINNAGKAKGKFDYIPYAADILTTHKPK